MHPKQKKVLLLVSGLVVLAVVVSLAAFGKDGESLQGKLKCPECIQKLLEAQQAERDAYCALHPGEKHPGYTVNGAPYLCPIVSVTPKNGASLSLSNIVAGGSSDLYFQFTTTKPTRNNGKAKIIFPNDFDFDPTKMDISNCYWKGQLLSSAQYFARQIIIDYLPAAPAGTTLSCNVLALTNPNKPGDYGPVEFKILHDDQADDGEMVEWFRVDSVKIIAPEPPPPPPTDYAPSNGLATPHVDYSSSSGVGTGLGDDAIETKAVDEYSVQQQNPQLLDSASSATTGAVQNSSGDYSMIRYKR